MPILKRALTRSAPRSAMRLARSWTVIASGTTTSRTCLADGPACWWARFSFSRARRSAARLRARLSSSPDRARVTVSLPRWRWSSRPRLGRGVSVRLGAGAWPPGRRAPRSSSAGSSAAAGSGAGGGASASRCASSAARRASSAACSSARRFSSARRRSSSLALRCALSSRRRASPSDCIRASSASRSSCACISLRRVMSSTGAERAGLAAGAAGLGASGLGASAAGAGSAALGASASPGLPRIRRFLTSTTTVFDRPWLKLCFTLPVSTVRLMPSGGLVPSFGFSVWSVILFLQLLQPCRFARRERRPPSQHPGQ